VPEMVSGAAAFGFCSEEGRWGAAQA